MRRNVLIVDDDDHVLELVKLFLDQAGFEARTCKDGFSALSEIQANPYDLVILDISMPYLSGIRVLKSLKGDDLMKTIPVIMLTGSDNVDHIQEAAKLGVTDYVLKPPKKEDLLKRIERVLGGRPQFQEIKIPDTDLNGIGSFELKLNLVSLSRRGMVLKGTVPLPKNYLLVNLQLPLFKQMKIEHKGFRVADCTETEDGSYFYHVSFIGMNKRDQEKIADKVMKDSFSTRNSAKRSS